jgi:hypothetical protein
MTNLKSALIVIIADQSVELLLWQHQCLALHSVYKSVPSDDSAFMSALRSFPKLPVLVLADLMDEHFRYDQIVHVSGSDRAALIKRKLDFSFRNTRYRLGHVTSREQSGRKLDNLLLTAINKQDLVDYWVNLLLDEKRAIASVTSTPWLLRNYLPLSKLDKEQDLLLISVDHISCALRQSYFQAGKLLFSRLANVVPNASTNLAEELNYETLQIRQYLERIQFVNYEAPLKIQVLSTLDTTQLNLTPYTTDTNLFELNNVQLQCRRFVAGEFQDDATTLHHLLALTLNSGNISNTYGSGEMTHYFDMRQLSKRISIAAGVVLAGALMACAPKLVSLLNKQEQQQRVAQQTAPLLRQHEAIAAQFPKNELPSAEIAQLVESSALFEKQAYDPFAAMNIVSAAFSQVSGLQLQSIRWELIEKTTDSSTRASTAPRLRNTIMLKPLTDALLVERTQIKLSLSGEAYSPSSFRSAQEQVQALIANIQAQPGITIVATQLPVDVRTDVKVSTIVNDSEVRQPFSIELVQDVLPTTTTVAEVQR